MMPKLVRSKATAPYFLTEKPRSLEQHGMQLGMPALSEDESLGKISLSRCILKFLA
jgi:hypothetical protein